MKKTAALAVTFMFLLLPTARAFPLDMTFSPWIKSTFPANHYVNIVQSSTQYGDEISVNTMGYPGAFEMYYDFFAYYDEIFVVPPNGSVAVKGYFRYNDVTPHPDRKYLAVYLLRPDLSGFITNVTRILDYASGDEPGVWYYRSKVISGLTPREQYKVAFGRGDLCDMDRSLEASWAAIELVSCRILKIPTSYSTIQQAIAESSAGDIIIVASGTYHEHLVIDKNNLQIVGESYSTTIIDANGESGSTNATICITGKDLYLSGFTIRNSLNMDGITIYGEGATIIENNIMNNNAGIRLLCNDCRILGNSIYNNFQGIWMQSSVQSCSFHYNNFFNNTQHVYCQPPYQGMNSWDNSHMGNFWSNHAGTDMNGDGIGDLPYQINPDNIDHFPLMSPYMYGDVNHDGKINMVDVGFVARRFGCTPTNPLWSFYADINEDKKIDMQDIGIAARKFGEIWSYP